MLPNDLRLIRCRRVQNGLQTAVQFYAPGGANLGGAKHLDVPHGVIAITFGQPGTDQVADQPLAGKTGGFDHEKVIIPPAFYGHLPFHNAVGVLYNHAFLRLAEDLIQPYGGQNVCLQDLPQHTAGANAGQLVGITYHNNAAVVTRGGQQRLEQLGIYHTHLIQNDNVKREKILFIMNKTHAAGRIVHFQQSVDGGSAVAGQLGQPLGGAAGGGTQGNPVINTFIQIQNRFDRCGFAGTGTAGQNHYAGREC